VKIIHDSIHDNSPGVDCGFVGTRCRLDRNIAYPELTAETAMKTRYLLGVHCDSYRVSCAARGWS